jgi:phosphate transport system substrate-binding protein
MAIKRCGSVSKAAWFAVKSFPFCLQNGLHSWRPFALLKFDLLSLARLSRRSRRGRPASPGLFYVSITRAKNELYLTCPLMRGGFGASGVDTCQSPSRFLSEIPKELLNKSNGICADLAVMLVFQGKGNRNFSLAETGRLEKMDRKSTETMKENTFMNPNFQPKLSSLAKMFAPALAVFLGVLAAAAQDKIIIRGSNTIGEELAPRLIAEYRKAHATVSFDLEFKGTAYGIGALMGGYCDIAAASRAVVKEQEEISQIRGVQFKEYILGAYTVSILVNAANPVSNLTSNQVQSLFTGKIQNWKEVGGPDAPVHLLIRDPVSGTYIGFKELAMDFQDYGEHVQLFTNYLGIADAVAKDPDAIGYAGLDLAQHAGTKAVSVDGVAPTAATVNGKKYPYARPLRFYTDAAKESAKTKDFVDFVLAPGGQQVLTQMGYAPKP